MDPTTFDPQTFDLGIVLTAAGVPIAAAIIASVIQLAKRIPVAGPALDAGKEAVAAMVLAAVLVALAFSSVGVPLTIVSVFGAFLAWVNLATFATKAYDVAPDALKSALGGTTTATPPTPPVTPSDPVPPTTPAAPVDVVVTPDPPAPDPVDPGVDQGTDVVPGDQPAAAAPSTVARCSSGTHGRMARHRRRTAGA